MMTSSASEKASGWPTAADMRLATAVKKRSIGALLEFVSRQERTSSAFGPVSRLGLDENNLSKAHI
jgi:hypothetical protein